MSTHLQLATPAALAETLRGRFYGQNATLPIQYTWQMLNLLPREVAAHPGSREFRNAQRAFWADRGIYLDATRREVNSAVAHLDRIGLLPGHVQIDRANHG